MRASFNYLNIYVRLSAWKENINNQAAGMNIKIDMRL
jgi:hypothetical protein